MSLLRRPLGTPFANEQVGSEQIGVIEGVPLFELDALASWAGVGADALVAAGAGFLFYFADDLRVPELRQCTLEEFRAELCYLGTYAADRQAGVDRLLVMPVQRRPQKRFAIGGAQYPDDFPWTDNMFFVGHLPPSLHPAFFCSARMTLNVTREAKGRYGYCPSGRLFEAAACGAPILTDWWEGLDNFFEPGTGILPVRSNEEVLAALTMRDRELKRIADAARERVLASHTAERRAEELESIFAKAEVVA